jgi:hypothetical protein
MSLTTKGLGVKSQPFSFTQTIWRYNKFMSTMMSDSDTISELRRRFAENEPFFFTRFGDADLLFMDDPNFKLNRRHDPHPRMTEELQEAFQIDDPAFMIACVAGGNVFQKYEQKLIDIAEAYHGDRQYWSAICIHELYVQDHEAFTDFVKQGFHDKKVAMVGGPAVCKDPLVQKVFNVAEYHCLTDRNAYRHLQGNMRHIKRLADEYDILISALGQTTRVVAKRLWQNDYRDLQYFDVGSTVDALANRPLRSWIRRHADRRAIYQEIFA